MLAGGMWRDLSPSSLVMMDGQQLSVQVADVAAVVSTWQVVDGEQGVEAVAAATVCWEGGVDSM